MVWSHEAGEPRDVIGEHQVPRAVRLVIWVNGSHVDLRENHPLHRLPVTITIRVSNNNTMTSPFLPSLSPLFVVGGRKHRFLLEPRPHLVEELHHQLRLLVHHVGGGELGRQQLQFVVSPPEQFCKQK